MALRLSVPDRRPGGAAHLIGAGLPGAAVPGKRLEPLRGAGMALIGCDLAAIRGRLLRPARPRAAGGPRPT